MADAATVLACFNVAVRPSSTLTLSNGSPVAGTSALDSATCAHGVKFISASAKSTATSRSSACARYTSRIASASNLIVSRSLSCDTALMVPGVASTVRRPPVPCGS